MENNNINNEDPIELKKVGRGRPKNNSPVKPHPVIDKKEVKKLADKIIIQSELTKLPGEIKTSFNKESERLVYGLIIKGHPFNYIADFLFETNVCATQQSSNNLVNRVLNKMKSTLTSEDPEVMRSVIIHQYQDIYHKLILKGELTKASDILDKITKTMGLNKEKIELDIATYKINFE